MGEVNRPESKAVMKKTDRVKELVLDQLKKSPIVEAACQKAGITRTTFYRWKKDDSEFAKLADEALIEGQLLVNDLAENQLIGAVKDRNLSAVQYWLRHHHPSYANKLQISHDNQTDELTAEQEEVVRRALELASGSESQEQVINQLNYEHSNTISDHKSPGQSDSTGTGGNDDQGQENPRSDN